MEHIVRSTARSFSLAQPILLDLSKRLAVWRTRRALANLDADALNDIGVTRHDAQREAEMGIWDVPATWRRGS